MTRRQAQHTPGPWELDVLLDEDIGFRIRMGSSVPYRGIYEPQHIIEWDPGVRPVDDGEEPDIEHLQYLEAEANMERIVAAVNAVEGIPTEALEAGVIRELLEVLNDIVRRLEWDGWDDVDRTHICPVCGAYKYKHSPNCTMAKAVRLLHQI